MVLYKKKYQGRSHDERSIRTKSNKGLKQVCGIYKGKSGTENKGDILQGPDYNKERRDEWVRSGDTGNGIARSR